MLTAQSFTARDQRLERPLPYSGALANRVAHSSLMTKYQRLHRYGAMRPHL